MSRPTPLRAVQEALLDYSRERRRSRSRNRKTTQPCQEIVTEQPAALKAPVPDEIQELPKNEEFSPVDSPSPGIEPPNLPQIDVASLVPQLNRSEFHEIDLDSHDELEPKQKKLVADQDSSVKSAQKGIKSSILSRVKSWLHLPHGRLHETEFTAPEARVLLLLPGVQIPVTSTSLNQSPLRGINSLESVAGSLFSVRSHSEANEPDQNKNVNSASDLKGSSTLDSLSSDATVGVYKENDADTLGTISDIHGGSCCLCSSAPQYNVQRDFKNDKLPAQTRFIQKVCLIIAIKCLLVSFWMFFSSKDGFDEFNQFYDLDDLVHYHLISAGIYGSLKLVVRLVPFLAKRHWIIYVILFMIEIIAASDFMAYVLSQCPIHYYEQAETILECLLGTLLFFIIIGSFAPFEMRDGIMMASAAIVTLLTCSTQVISDVVDGQDTPALNMTEQILNSIAVLGISEALVVIFTFELKSILTGYRFHVLTSDWFFTAVYII